MIPNQWYVVLESKEIPKGKPIGVTRMGEKIVFWRDAAGELTAQSDLCPHRGAALSIGKLVGNCIQCPFHGFEFDPTGRCTLIPANGQAAPLPKAMQVRTYPIREAHGLVYLWWSNAAVNPTRPDVELPNLPAFDFMGNPTFGYDTFVDYWPIHYSRAIENQLDVVHLPFVHHNTIGRGGLTVVHGPRYRRVAFPGGSDQIEFWVDNEVDSGQIARRPSEMPETSRSPLILFRFPNIWQNRLGERLRIFLAFVPVDENNTRMYLRMYQSIVTAPVLKQLFFAFSRLGNRYIFNQDKRVVITQRPSRTERNMGEKLIPGDLPIVEYRRRRAELIAAGQASHLTSANQV